jgi:hypothetical protein
VSVDGRDSGVASSWEDEELFLGDMGVHEVTFVAGKKRASLRVRVTPEGPEVPPVIRLTL